MSAPDPAKVIDVLNGDVNEFYTSLNFTNEFDQREYGDLVQRAKEIAAHDVLNSSLLLAKLASVTGDIGEYERWVRNAELNQGVNRARHVRFQHAINHGFASDGQALIPEALKFRENINLMKLAIGMYAVGAFKGIVDTVDASQANQEVVNMTRLLEQAKVAASVVQALSITDADIAKMLDVAGEVLREHHLLWESECLDVIALPPGQGGPAISMEYRVYMKPDEAAAMNWEVAERLLDRSLDRACVTVGFLGRRVT